MSIYLDYNASTPLDERVLSVMIDTYRNKYGNPDSRTHDFGINARSVIESARKNVAELLDVKADEVFFTSGATESDNIVLLGLAEYGKKVGKTHIITSSIEHKAVLEPLEILKKHGFEVTHIAPDNSGKIDADKVLDQVRENTLIVSIMHVNNETGIIQPVDIIGEELDKTEVFFHIDAAQSFGKLVGEIRKIKYDFLSASAHKMYGPQGIGALIMRKTNYKLPPITPIMYGGGQEHGVHPGTVPTALVAGMGEACRIALKEYRENDEKCRAIQNTIISLLDESGLRYNINGDINNTISNTINISFTGVNSEALMLATKDFCSISNGSACNSSSYKPSYVLSSMGLDIERIESAVRISWGSSSDVKKNFMKLIDVAKSLT